MLFDVTLRRLWRERRAMSVLFVALVFVCAFMALGTLYVRAVAESEFAIRLENLRPADFQIEIRNAQPITEEAATIFDDLFGTGSRHQTAIKASTEGAMSDSPSDTFQPFVYAYRDFDQLFTLIAGRLPEKTDLPNQIEVVLTNLGADTLERFIRALGSQEAIIGFEIWAGDARLKVVGIVSSIYPPNHPYWNPAREYLTGERLTVGNSDVLFITPITSEAILIDEISQITATRFSWLIDLDPALVSVANLNTLYDNIQNLEQSLLKHHPNITINTPLKTIISDFNESIRQTEIPVFFLSTAILAVLLYSLLTINTLILESQKTEWAIITSRGGSVGQLMLIHALAMGILGICAILIAPFVAQGILVILSIVGPQASIINAPTFGDIPLNAFLNSLITGLIAVIVLIISGWGIARAGLLSLKQSVSRPPTQPAWAAFGLDFILLGLGLAFIARLYFLVIGDDQSLFDLIKNPSIFIQAIAQQGAESLNDPFNIAGPILFLAGATLLWMRLFPHLIRIIGGIINRSHNFTLRLAFWNVEREPTHYAQIVLLLIGTLAMGIISLSLAHTRSADAWQTAYNRTGADAVVHLNSHTPDIAWDSLPNVTDYQVMTQSTWESFTPTGDLQLFGIRDDLFHDMLTADISDEYPPLELDGIAIPDAISHIIIDAYIEPVITEDDALITHQITANLRMKNGAPFDLPLVTPDHTRIRDWITYHGDLSAYDTAGWVLVGFTFEGQTTQTGRRALDQAVTLDNLRVMTDDNQMIVLETFESIENWERKTQSGTTGGVILSYDITSERATDGQTALRVFMQLNATRINPPRLDYQSISAQPIPVIISSQLASVLRGRLGQSNPIAVGDTLNMDFSRRRGSEGITNRLQLDYVVVGIQDDYLSMPENGLFMIARENDLLMTLNRNTTPAQFYQTNRVWLTLSGNQPSSELRASLTDFEVDYTWTRYSAIQREPLPNAITGMLFAGFWVSLGLILVDFAFYLAITTRRRAASFAVLEALGWERGGILRLLIAEQITFITPALIVGVTLGFIMAYLILPFIALGTGVLHIPVIKIMGLLLILIVSFTVLLGFTAERLRRVDPTHAFRHNQ